MTDIGNFAFASHSTQQNIRDFQTDPRLTWDYIAHKDGLRYIRPGIHIILANQGNIDRPNMTDFAFINDRFNQAVLYKDQYEYGVFLLYEELINPALRANWLPRSSNISTWFTVGTLTVGGQTLELIETWYKYKYGTWNAGWWESVKAANNFNDPIVKEWSDEYASKLYRAWHSHMRAIGKKSCITGAIGMSGDGVKTFKEFFPQCWEFIAENYDALIMYRYPNAIGEGDRGTDASRTAAQGMRAMCKGKLLWILTLCFEGAEDNTCPWDLEVAKDEYNKVAPYVDVVLVPPYTNAPLSPSAVEYPPLLIQMWTANPTPTPAPRPAFSIMINSVPPSTMITVDGNSI